MALIFLVQVDPATSELLRAGGDIPADAQFQAVEDPGGLTAALTDRTLEVDAVVIGTAVADPIRVAQRVHTLSRDVGVIVLSEGSRLENLVQAVKFSPLIGVGIACVAVEESARVQDALRRTVAAARRHRVHRTTVAAVEARMQAQPAPVSQGTYVEHLLHHAPVGVVATDESGKVLAWNSFATRLTGITEREALGSSFPSLYSESWQGPIQALIADAFGGLNDSPPRPLIVESGAFAVEITASPLRGRSDIRRAVLLLRDVTDQLRAEREVARTTQQLRTTNEELAKARDKAVEASRAKSTFLANMSHELRTPLNAIIGYSEMLQEQARDERQEGVAADLHRIQSAGRHLLLLINDILDLSKIEAGKMEIYVSRFDLRALVDEVATMVQPSVEKHGNRLTVVCPPGCGAMQADETKVRQILFNLLSNAAKFTENGQITLTVEREPGDKGGTVAFRISDTGIGMNEKQLDSLFREFVQVDSSTTRRHGGTGLGLAISRRFCRMMGGEVTVTSEPGVGSTFIARIPVLVSGRPASRDNFIEGELTAFVPPTQTPSPNPVLVIDDDPNVHELLRRLLEKESFSVVGALNGRHGVEMARELQPRAIILDILMPEMDGWSVLTELKADPRVADIPVVIVSIVDEKNLGFALGATDYLIKPVERERLLSILRKYECGLGGCRVLVVEDDPDTGDLLTRLLIAAGCSPVIAANGREGLRALESGPADIILLDLMMPEMDGFEFLEAIRREEQWRTIPVIVITAKELDDEDHRRLNGEVERVLHKGRYTRDDLLREISEVVFKLSRAGE